MDHGAAADDGIVRLAYIDKDLVLQTDYPGDPSSPPCTFAYHPFEYDEIGEVQDAIQAAMKKSRKDGEQALRSEVVKRLRKWTVSKPDGSLVDFKNPDEMRRVSPKIIDFIFSAMLDPARGYEKGQESRHPARIFVEESLGK